MNYMQQSYLGDSEYRTASSADRCGPLDELRLPSWRPTVCSATSMVLCANCLGEPIR
ncbi:hypothetical protein AGR4C_pa30004 [Agrobacterium tumefaciens str. Kerr 14]|uniref:Uncharacterized protein n=1 Tax=Agrobacterium tumefaciens str. Kerr 14 TaxID=1183424 RepID=A0A1S7S9R0_AGRTU|nr:hypothetical protein AGR4C_pa30004 [Agrobacterium tumefaciens str. Kerr 14]